MNPVQIFQYQFKLVFLFFGRRNRYFNLFRQRSFCGMFFALGRSFLPQCFLFGFSFSYFFCCCIRFSFGFGFSIRPCFCFSVRFCLGLRL